MLTAFPSSRPAQDHHQQQQQHNAAVPEHPQLPVLRCRTTRHRAVGDGAGCTPVAGSRDRERDGSFTPLYGGGSPIQVDSCGGPGADSAFTPRAGSEDRDVDAPMGNGVRAGGHKRSRGGQVGVFAVCWLVGPAWPLPGMGCVCGPEHTTLLALMCDGPGSLQS